MAFKRHRHSVRAKAFGAQDGEVRVPPVHHGTASSRCAAPFEWPKLPIIPNPGDSKLEIRVPHLAF
jgi:hypothetical protein